jgi:arsenate reductase
LITVYGLKNCDTCRKALKWLKAEGVEHRFHDVRANGVSRADIAGWAAKAGWETLLNRRGTTWRGLPEADKTNVDEAKAVTLMAAHPALIKRPVFEIDGAVAVGFDDAARDAVSGRKLSI